MTEALRWDVPSSWMWGTISQVVAQVVSASPAARYGDGPFQYIDLSSTARGRVTAPKTLKGTEAPSRARQPVERGDTLYSCVRVYLGNVAFVESDSADLIASTAYCVLRPSAVNPRYLFHYVTWAKFTQWMLPLQRGNSPPAVVDSDVKAQPIPLPPLAEQERIATRVDELLAEIAEGEAALAEARRELETFRRALLKAAVTGELTRDWRMSTRGEGNSVGTVASALPGGWRWSTLGQLAEITGGVTVDKKRKPADPITVPYLRVANVQRGHIDLAEVKQITVERRTAERLRLKAGDVLLNEGGDRDKIGRGWVWGGSVPDMIHQNHVFCARLRSSETNPYFVSHYANELGRRFFVEQGKQTTNLASISLTRIATLPVPVPPSAEVAEIVRRIEDGLSAVADSLAQLDAEAADAARLKPAILKAAFEGRLSHQDENDEPASALLARLGQSGRSPTKRPRRAKATT